MISFLRGLVFSKDLGSAVMDVSGVGYFVSMTQDAVQSLPPVGQEATVVCRMIVSDSGIALYGFSSAGERALFDDLITVSGIGPKTALAALSVLSADQLASAIGAQDIKTLSRVPGVGKKSASRIALELKEKYPDGESLFDAGASAASEPKLEGVAEALSSMGFTASEIASALEGADPAEPESITLQRALKRLAR